MTYYNNPLLPVMQGYLKNNPAFQDNLLMDFGVVPIQLPPDQSKFQWNALFSTGAKVKVSDGLTFPDQGDASLESITGSRKYFNSLIRLDELKYKSFIGGDEYQVNRVGLMMQDAVYAIVEELKKRCIGKGITASTSDWYYDADWKRFAYKPSGDSDGTAELPIPFMEKITPDGGSAGTPQTTLAMGCVLRGSNRTEDFNSALIGPILEGALQVKDSTTGKRLLKSESSTFGSTDKVLLHMNPLTIMAMKRTKVMDKAGNSLNVSIFDDLLKYGVEVKPNDNYAFSAAEDGACEVGVFINPKDNFFLGMAGNLQVDGFEVVTSTNGEKSAIQRYIQPAATGVRPYKIGSQYYSGYAEVSFLFANNS